MKTARILALIATLSLILIPIASAGASGPTRTLLPLSHFTVRGACPFPVRFADTFAQVTEKDFYDTSGNLVRSIFSGPERPRLTNLTTGKRIVVNSSAKATITYSPDGSFTFVSSGSSVGFFHSNISGMASDLVLNRGHAVFFVDAAGNILTDQSYFHGLSTDLCAPLSG